MHPYGPEGDCEDWKPKPCRSLPAKIAIAQETLKVDSNRRIDDMESAFDFVDSGINTLIDQCLYICRDFEVKLLIPRKLLYHWLHRRDPIELRPILHVLADTFHRLHSISPIEDFPGKDHLETQIAVFYSSNIYLEQDRNLLDQLNETIYPECFLIVKLSFA